MGKKVKLTLLLVVVFIAGGVTGLITAQVLWMRNAMAPFYSTGLTEIAIDAQQLSRNEADELLKRKVMALAPLTQSYHKVFFKFMPDNNARYTPLWQVQKYYELSGDEVPAEIKPILDSLPPRPLTSCERERLEETQSTTEQDAP